MNEVKRDSGRDLLPFFLSFFLPLSLAFVVSCDR
jgi:hypothetical protein